jgi:addiction module RelE/StbE family toxin
LEKIFAYIANRLFAPTAAHKLREKIEKSIMRLCDHPLSGNLCEDAMLRGKGYRKLVVENYIVFHLVNEDSRQVVIARVLYSQMDYGRLL